jgi:hypothetical protein
VPRRVEVHHRTGVDEAVDRGRLQPDGDAGLAVRADDGVGVPVRDVRRDARHGQDGDRGRHSDGPVHTSRKDWSISGSVPGFTAKAFTVRLPFPASGGL